MYRKILVPLDGSEVAEAVLPHACALAERFGAELVLLCIPIDPTDDLLFTGAKLTAATRAKLDTVRLEAERYLARVAARVKAEGLRVTARVCEGLVVETILTCAQEDGVDLITISPRGRGGMEHWLMGSVTYRILHGASVPVLMISPSPGADDKKDRAVTQGETAAVGEYHLEMV